MAILRTLQGDYDGNSGVMIETLEGTFTPYLQLSGDELAGDFMPDTFYVRYPDGRLEAHTLQGDELGNPFAFLAKLAKGMKFKGLGKAAKPRGLNALKPKNVLRNPGAALRTGFHAVHAAPLAPILGTQAKGLQLHKSLFGTKGLPTKIFGKGGAKGPFRMKLPGKMSPMDLLQILPQPSEQQSSDTKETEDSQTEFNAANTQAIPAVGSSSRFGGGGGGGSGYSGYEYDDYDDEYDDDRPSGRSRDEEDDDEDEEGDERPSGRYRDDDYEDRRSSRRDDEEDDEDDYDYDEMDGDLVALHGIAYPATLAGDGEFLPMEAVYNDGSRRSITRRHLDAMRPRLAGTGVMMSPHGGLIGRLPVRTPRVMILPLSPTLSGPLDFLNPTAGQGKRKKKLLMENLLIAQTGNPDLAAAQVFRNYKNTQKNKEERKKADTIRKVGAAVGAVVGTVATGGLGAIGGVLGSAGSAIASGASSVGGWISSLGVGGLFKTIGSGIGGILSKAGSAGSSLMGLFGGSEGVTGLMGKIVSADPEAGAKAASPEGMQILADNAEKMGLKPINVEPGSEIDLNTGLTRMNISPADEVTLINTSLPQLKALPDSVVSENLMSTNSGGSIATNPNQKIGWFGKSDEEGGFSKLLIPASLATVAYFVFFKEE